MISKRHTKEEYDLLGIKPVLPSQKLIEIEKRIRIIRLYLCS